MQHNDSINLFKKLADEETADLDANIMDWMPDPRTYCWVACPQQPQGGMDDDNTTFATKTVEPFRRRPSFLVK